jgi:drug/metabolite transporter (DMT)-like permease
MNSRTTDRTLGSAGIAFLAPVDLVLLLLLTLFWGINWPAMKLALSQIPIWHFRLFCLVTGSIGLFAIARLQGLRLGVPRQALWPLIVCSMLNVVLWQLFSGLGLLYIEAGRASIIAYTMPLWSTLFAWPVLGERIGLRPILGLGLGLPGLGVLLPHEFAQHESAWLGIAFMLAAAIAWGFGTLALKAYRFSMPTVLVAGWQLALAIPAMALGAALEPLPELDQIGLPALAGTAYAAIIPMIFCHYTWFRLVGLLPASVAAISTLAIPVVGVFSSALVLGEVLGLREILALVLVVLALGIVLIGRRG